MLLLSLLLPLLLLAIVVEAPGEDAVAAVLVAVATEEISLAGDFPPVTTAVDGAVFPCDDMVLRRSERTEIILLLLMMLLFLVLLLTTSPPSSNRKS